VKSWVNVESPPHELVLTYCYRKSASAQGKTGSVSSGDVSASKGMNGHKGVPARRGCARRKERGDECRKEWEKAFLFRDRSNQGRKAVLRSVARIKKHEPGQRLMRATKQPCERLRTGGGGMEKTAVHCAICLEGEFRTFSLAGAGTSR